MTLKKCYALECNGRACLIDSINDHVVCIGAKIMASKVVRKNCPVQCNFRVVACAKLCAQGTQLNLSLFLMNQLVEDAKATHEGTRSFTESWILIFITLVSWMEPEDYQGMDVKVVEVCKGAKYQNLCWVKEVERMVDCLIQFWIYWEVLQTTVIKVPQLTEEVVTKYQRIAHFSIGPHTVYVHAW